MARSGLMRLDGLYRVWLPGADSEDFRVEGGHVVDASSTLDATLAGWSAFLAASVAIVGCRPPWRENDTPANWQTFDVIRRDVSAFVEALPAGSAVVSGGARGVDTTAREMARRRRLLVVECLPDTIRYDPKVAPLMRNTTIVALVGSGKVHGWPSPWSRGTYDTLRKGGDRAVEHRLWQDEGRRMG